MNIDEIQALLSQTAKPISITKPIASTKAAPKSHPISQTTTYSPNLQNIAHLQAILKSDGTSASYSNYSMNKKTIIRVFTHFNSYSYEDILARLTLIDSMYSTQMNRRYYGLDELAYTLESLHKIKPLRERFLHFLSSHNIEDFDIQIDGTNKNLWTETYGIGKDGNDKGTAVSLISKYAYFETDLQFPIYDSIAREIYPLIWNYCGFPKKECPSQQSLKNLVDFINAIDTLIEKLGGSQIANYNTLDCLLWTTGKILRGNLSLLIRQNDYQKYIKNFDIRNCDLDEFPFIQQSPLKPYFELAKQIATSNE